MIRIKFRDSDNDVFETMLLEDRPDVGPELRGHKAPGCDAGPTQPLDVPVEHCPACSTSIADQLGLRPDEIERIRRWREAKDMSPDDRAEENMTPDELGVILDKIIDKLDTTSDHDDGDNDTVRIVVEVEPTP